MKILFLYSRMDLGGIQSAFFNRIKALNASGITADILFYKEGPALDTYTGLNVYISSNIKKIAGLIIDNDYDCLVWINQIVYMKSLLNQQVISRRKHCIILEIRGMDHYTFDLLSHGIGFQQLPIAGILTPARHLTEKVYRITEKKYPVYTIPNCIDPELFSMDNNRISNVASHPRPHKHRKVLGWIGRLDTNKNWIEYLQILSSLVDQDKEWEGWVVSQFNISSQVYQFKKLCLHLSLKNHVRVFHSVPYKYMSYIYYGMREAEGILLSTSKSEGCPNILLEAMACGCTILSADNDAAKEVLADNTGFLYKKGNIKNAITIIKSIQSMNNTKFYEIRKIQAMHIQNNYSYDMVAKCYNNIIHKIRSF